MAAAAALGSEEVLIVRDGEGTRSGVAKGAKLSEVESMTANECAEP
jgi:hypothetical protein